MAPPQLPGGWGGASLILQPPGWGKAYAGTPNLSLQGPELAGLGGGGYPTRQSLESEAGTHVSRQAPAEGPGVLVSPGHQLLTLSGSGRGKVPSAEL